MTTEDAVQAPGQPVMNRWLVVVGAILIQLCLGAIYAWSVFTPPLCAQELFTKELAFKTELQEGEPSALLRETFRSKGQTPIENKAEGPVLTDTSELAIVEVDKVWKLTDGEETYTIKVVDTYEAQGGSTERIQVEKLKFYRDGKYNFSATQTQIIFSVGLATFALVMILAGRWQAKVGPTLVARIGGLVLGAGYVLGGLACQSLSGSAAFWAILVTVGLIGGAGIGLAYVVPIAVGVKWFPDKKGMITGLAVAGFGFGALIWIYLGQGLPAWIGIKTTGLISSLGVASVFLTYGIAFFILVMLGSVWMKNPPVGWKPAGWEPATTGAAAAGTGVQFEPPQMLRTPQFYLLWVMFIFGALAGLMVIGIIKLFGIDALQASGMDQKTASTTAGTAMALFYALANGLGRIVWGMVSDKLGRRMSLVLMMAIQGIVMLIFFHMGSVVGLLFLGAALIGFNFGGNFALFPAATADYFGNKNVGANYGWMFTAYGVGGIVGPIMAGLFKDAGVAKGVDAWYPAFIIAGVACLVAAVIGLMLRPPKATDVPITD
ncbi:MAG: OFA family MFS transporter [Planctomycetota bacterium]